MKTMMKTVAAAGALLLLASCGKNESPKPPRQVVGYDAYITGSCQFSQNEQRRAYYWLNGERVDVTDGTKPAEFSSVIASGGSVYIAGMEDDQPFYMKDGTRVPLTNRYHQTYDIAVENGSVYVLGYGFYWKGSDEVVELPKDTFYASSLAVSDGKVYVAGDLVNDRDTPYAACWTGGNLSQLAVPDGSKGSYGECATASGGSIYIGGRYFDKERQQRPCYWKDGVFTLLENVPGLGGVKAITVVDGKVYAAVEYSFVGCYWVDGKSVPLEVPDNVRLLYLDGIAVGGGKVYVAGRCGTRDGGEFPCYWIDGKRYALEIEGNPDNQWVTDMALVEKYADDTSPATN